MVKNTVFTYGLQSLGENMSRIYEKKKKIAQRGARTHDPEIKSLMLYRLS